MFPAAKTGMAPFCQAYSIPASRPDPTTGFSTESSGPRLRLTILAPLLTTHSMPALMSSVLPLPSDASALATTKRASGATPAMPLPFPVTAAAIPLT